MATRQFEDLVRVEGQAPMGQLMRQYWAPAIQSERLIPDGAPQRLRLFGEDLVAFRGTDGTVCIVDERCPHRGASLVLARNENCGLRCLLHGWKIGTNGKVVEAANMPAAARLDKIPTGHRPTHESAGIVWAWFGDPESVPPPPAHNFANVPEGHIVTLASTIGCNWLQLLETLWDPYHISWLHMDSIDRSYDTSDEDGFHTSGIPEHTFYPAEFGFRYTTASDNITLGVPFVMPWYSHHILGGTNQADRVVLAHVPVDDTHTMLWAIIYNIDMPLDPKGNGMAMFNGFPKAFEYRDEFRPENLWAQDREAMRDGRSHSGIGFRNGTMSVLLEDFALTESMGPILDRKREHLAPSDVLIVKGRNVLWDALEKFARGEAPPGSGSEVAIARSTIDRQAKAPAQQ
jgi:phthalate 4,5-dioxygenase